MPLCPEYPDNDETLQPIWEETLLRFGSCMGQHDPDMTLTSSARDELRSKFCQTIGKNLPDIGMEQWNDTGRDYIARRVCSIAEIAVYLARHLDHTDRMSAFHVDWATRIVVAHAQRTLARFERFDRMRAARASAGPEQEAATAELAPPPGDETWEPIFARYCR